MVMRHTLTALSLVIAAATAAAPAPDPLLSQIIAGARAVPASAIAWERTQKQIGQDEGAAAENHSRVDRWDGQKLVPISVDGKPPSADDIAQGIKASAGRPVPGYHRVADFLKAGAVRATDAQGRTVYRITGLPKGTINIGKDISADLVAEALIDTSGPQPYVSRLRLTLPKPLSFFLVAKLDRFEAVSDYRIGPDGRPQLVRSTQAVSGSQMGKAGTTRSESAYTYLR